VGQERLGPSYIFIPLVLGPLNRLVWWEVPLGYIALRSFLFLQEQIKDIIITVSVHVMWDAQETITSQPKSICGMPRTARWASYDGEALCDDRSERARVQRHPGTLSTSFLALSPATTRTLFTKYGIYAWRLSKYHRIHTWQDTGRRQSGYSSGSHERLPLMNLWLFFLQEQIKAIIIVSTPDPNQGQAPELEMVTSVKRHVNNSVH
jgi:hypothetical protein